ncbi:DeoR family transcriptional regulator [Escherichia coli]
MQVNDLSALYGVSTVTIRNDLAFLEKQGSPCVPMVAR